jgi:hypothetical protein
MAVNAAFEAHNFFNEHYINYRSAFSTVLLDTGLGIGIDFGEVAIARVANTLSIVGQPVVYACRMSGAPAGKTFLNQPAYDNIFNNFSGYLNFSEESIEFKHERNMLAYRIESNSKKIPIEPPEWTTESEKSSENKQNKRK